jgi:membrane-associated phospholipid phosphatase
VALAGLVAAGALDGVDSYAVHHLMPGLDPRHVSGSVFSGLVPFLHAATSSALSNATDAVSLPGSPVLALVFFAVACRVLWRRGDRAEAVLWAGAFVVGNLAELVAKGLLRRPALFDEGIHVDSFDSSYPSGHALRVALVAALACRVWPRTAPLAVALVVAAAVLLVAGGWHTPSDVVGGLLLAALLVAGAVSAGRPARRDVGAWRKE